MPEPEVSDEDYAAAFEADEYDVLQAHDVDDDPPETRPVGPGDVFEDIELNNLAEPFRGPVMVVGHPCSLRRGLELQADVPVAPIDEPAIATAQHPHADRVLPVRKWLPPGSSRNRVVQLTRTTTVPSSALSMASRCATLSAAGVVALQQRVVGNQTRVKIPPRIVAAHCRGPLVELELWTDWREAAAQTNGDAAAWDEHFEAFMRSDSGFGGLPWREALADHEHARGRAVAALEQALAALRRS